MALDWNEPGKNLMCGVTLLFLSLATSFVLGQEGNRSEVSEARLDRASVRTVVLSDDQIRDLIRQASERDLVNEKKQRDYTYIKQERTSRRNGKGDPQSVESRTYEVLFLY